MPSSRPLRIRTLTAGLDLSRGVDLARVGSAAAALHRMKQACESAGYEVQTIRIAGSPWTLDLQHAAQRLSELRDLDRALDELGIIASLGPLSSRDAAEHVAQWTKELVRNTARLSFSVCVADEQGVDPAAAELAARIMVALSTAVPAGVGNFRFAAAANIPSGTPFFPVAWHRGEDAIAVGLEAASVVEGAFAEVSSMATATDRLRHHLDRTLAPVEQLVANLAEREQRVYLGIDSSPAPAQDRSIAAAIEALTKAPFGAPGTLEACAAITAALKSLAVKTCGYSGLMLPVLEDPLLAQRADEGRYRIRDLLLYSSVCGTGLDVVPIPGDTSPIAIAGLLRDVGALATKLHKPLSARLFLVPGQQAGDLAHFNDPLLSDCRVMTLN